MLYTTAFPSNLFNMSHFSSSDYPRQACFLAALGLLATVGTAQAQTPASFGAVSTYSAGANSGPASIAVADVNGDGRPDLITANSYSNTAGVLLGQVGGGFAAVNSYPIGANSGPVAIAVADVNGDGRPDLITANISSNTAGVLLGQVGGGFAAVNSYPTGANSGPTAIALADVNVDGRLDIITANYGNNTAGVLLGQAGGGFAAITSYPTGDAPTGIAVADVNSDGRPDLVTVNIGFNTVAVRLGQASGGFATVSSYPTGSSPRGIVVADVNGDGRLDLGTANASSNFVGVLLGQAGGGFTAVSTYPTGAGTYPSGIAVADVNGDGRPDLITANKFTSTAGVLLGQAGGGFVTVSTYSAGANSGPAGIAVADVNGDGRLDLITANTGSNTVGVLLNTGTFTPLGATPVAPAADEVALFPNPARGSFAVRLPAVWGAGPVRAELLNALGQVMASRSAVLLAGGASLNFATEGLAPGVYTLSLQAGSHTLAKRVVLD